MEQNLKNRYDREIKRLEFKETHTHYSAIIKQVEPTIIVDIYPTGVIKDGEGNITNEPKYEDIDALALNVTDIFKKKDEIKVCLFDGTAYILPEMIPRGVRRAGNVLIVHEDGHTIGWDYPQFYLGQ